MAKQKRGNLEAYKETMAGTSKVMELRNLVNPPGKKGTWLRHLNDANLLELYYRAKAGEGLLSLCRAAKSWTPKTKHATESTVIKAVRRFVDEAAGELRKEVREAAGITADDTEDYISPPAEKAIQKVAEKLDSVNEYIWMIEEQKNRIAGMIEKEKEENSNFELTEKAFRNFREMLDSYVATCVRLGVVDSTPPELNITMKHQFEALMNTTVKNDKAKLIQACDSFTKQLENSAITLIQNEDGAYVRGSDE